MNTLYIIYIFMSSLAPGRRAAEEDNQFFITVFLAFYFIFFYSVGYLFHRITPRARALLCFTCVCVCARAFINVIIIVCPVHNIIHSRA